MCDGLKLLWKYAKKCKKYDKIKNADYRILMVMKIED